LFCLSPEPSPWLERATSGHSTARRAANWLARQRPRLLYLNPTAAVQVMQDAYRDAIERVREPTFTPPPPLPRRGVAAVMAEYLSYVEELPERRFGRLAQWRAVTTMVALRLYHLKHGRYPDSLQGLVPDYLPAVPQDPFGGAPLKYRRDGDSYVLYSLGPNLKDDGGRKGEDWGTPGSEDYVYWPQ